MTFPIDTVIPLLERAVADYQVPVVDLIAAQTRDPFKVLTATILSARTKDEVTAAAVRRLFARAKTPAELARLELPELEKIIYPVGFFRNKAQYLHKLPAVLEEGFGGQVPDTMEGLLSLPGVGRKTANLVLAVAFNKAAICVDTHVHRIMNIWGYVQTSTPLQTEMALREKLPQKYWISINSILVAFGQELCRPISPHCDRCPIGELCPKICVVPRKNTSTSTSTHSETKTQSKKNRQEKKVKKFVSWNVNGLRAILNKGFLDAVSKLDADILALQEIKLQQDQIPKELLELPGYQSFWFPAQKKGYSGTAVFTRKTPEGLVYGLDSPLFDGEGRVMTLEYEDFYLINSYSPNAQPELKRLGPKQDFNQLLLAHMNRLRSKNNKSVILCGDLNVAHKEIDLARPKANIHNPGFSAEERAWMDEVTSLGYLDTFRMFNQSPGQYSWWSYRANAREKNIGWRIDYFLIDGASGERVLDAAIHADIHGSDHCPVSLLFA